MFYFSPSYVVIYFNLSICKRFAFVNLEAPLVGSYVPEAYKLSDKHAACWNKNS
jgi:hypothetical protein